MEAAANPKPFSSSIRVSSRSPLRWASTSRCSPSMARLPERSRYAASMRTRYCFPAGSEAATTSESLAAVAGAFCAACNSFDSWGVNQTMHICNYLILVHISCQHTHRVLFSWGHWACSDLGVVYFRSRAPVNGLEKSTLSRQHLASGRTGGSVRLWEGEG